MAIKRRNPVAHAPILRKGGVHQRARSGERQSVRQQLNDLLLDELEEYHATRQQTRQQGKGRDDPSKPDFSSRLAVLSPRLI